jgi:hypothetical protein
VLTVSLFIFDGVALNFVQAAQLLLRSLSAYCLLRRTASVPA